MPAKKKRKRRLSAKELARRAAQKKKAAAADDDAALVAVHVMPISSKVSSITVTQPKMRAAATYAQIVQSSPTPSSAATAKSSPASSTEEATAKLQIEAKSAPIAPDVHRTLPSVTFVSSIFRIEEFNRKFNRKMLRDGI